MNKQPWWYSLALAGCVLVADSAYAQSSRTSSSTTSSSGSSTQQTSSNSSNTSGGATSLRDSAGVQGLQQLSGMSATQVTNDVFSGGRGDPVTGEAGGTRRTTTTGGFGSTFGGGLSGGGRGGSTTRQNRDNKNRAQAVVRLGFSPPRGAATQTGSVALSIGKSLAAMSGVRAQVRVEGSTAILTGTAETAADRRVAERMALLEPGVRSVQNDIAVPPSNSSGG